jgi:methionyl-tRNA formyltransferase
MSKSLRIVFMGTPEFAVPMLDTLVHSQHQVVGVITAPDKPAGRGMQFQQSDVKKYAVEKGLHILQPEKLKNEAFLEELTGFTSRFICGGGLSYVACCGLEYATFRNH